MDGAGRRRILVKEAGVVRLTRYTATHMLQAQALQRAGLTEQEIAKALGLAQSMVWRLVRMELLEEEADRQEAAWALADTIPLP